MFSKIFARERKATENGNSYLMDWKARLKRQHDDMPKAGFNPIPDALLEKSDIAYSDPALQSMLIAELRQCHREFVHPVRVLFKTNLCLAIPQAAGDLVESIPSVGIEEACSFKIDAMNAAIESTPLDLLVLLGGSSLPSAEEWSQEAAWIAREFRNDTLESMDSLYRHMRALFLERIDTAPADFLAFREAAIALSYCSIFLVDDEAEKGTPGTKSYSVSWVAQDVFPSIKSRAGALLRRRAELVWHEESSDKEPVIPDHLIGISDGQRR